MRTWPQFQEKANCTQGILLVPIKKELSVMCLNKRGGGAFRNVGGGVGGLAKGSFIHWFSPFIDWRLCHVEEPQYGRNSCPWLPLPKFDHLLVSSVRRAPVCWVRFSLAQANLFVIFTVSSEKIAIWGNVSVGICLDGPASWCSLGGKSSSEGRKCALWSRQSHG